MEKGHQYHIVFLDIELKGENGIELAGIRINGFSFDNVVIPAKMAAGDIL